jgi:hypothetical protein
MNENIIDCSGFNFHLQPDKGYVIFDPQSQEENDRLDQLLGATELWNASIEKKRKEIDLSDKRFIAPFSELHQVGWTENNEIVAVVLAGAIGTGTRYDQIMTTGQWFAVRLLAEAEAELKADLTAELKLRQKNVEQTLKKMR